MAATDPDQRRGGGARRSDLGTDPQGLAFMSGISLDEARALLAERDLIAVGVRGDDERRRRHGARTTFVRVFEAHASAIPERIPAGAMPGEFRVTGTPASPDEAITAVKAALAAAGTVPVTAFSLADLFDLGGRTIAGLTELVRRLLDAGLQTVAEAPIDAFDEAVAEPAIQATVKAGLRVPRLTVREGSADGPERLMARAAELQRASGGIRAFAPLARVSSIAQPTTGYEDVKTIAVARLLVHNIESIQVDWALYGPKLAQVGLTVGADDVDSVSALEGDLGRRRSPVEEIRGNIKAAGLEPVERDGTFAILRD
jgi:aminodeoxyfutalosine synthase